MNGSKYVLLAATAEFCGHCQRMKPEFAKAAQEIADLGVTDLVFANIDCKKTDENDDLCQTYKLEYFPTLYWHQDGKWLGNEYKGGMKAQDFKTWTLLRTHRELAVPYMHKCDALDKEIKDSM